MTKVGVLASTRATSSVHSSRMIFGHDAAAQRKNSSLGREQLPCQAELVAAIVVRYTLLPFIRGSGRGRVQQRSHAERE